MHKPHTNPSVQTPCSETRKLRTEYHCLSACDFCWRICLRTALYRRFSASSRFLYPVTISSWRQVHKQQPVTPVPKKTDFLSTWLLFINLHTTKTRHRASTSTYLLTFCVLVVARTPPVEARSPGRCSNVENDPRRQPVAGQPATPTSHIRCTILRTPPVSGQQCSPSRPFALCRHIAGWTQACN